MDEIKRPLPHKFEHEIPRRYRIDLATPVERAIRDARQMVEVMDADVRLTDASELLGKALERVADYLEDVAAPPVEGKVARELAKEICGHRGPETVAEQTQRAVELLKTAPVEGKQEPGAEAAPPLCVICGKREEMHGASNQCNLDEEFSPRWTPPRAAAGESTERQLDLDGLIGQVLMGYGAGLTRDRIRQICEKWLAASQERSA